MTLDTEISRVVYTASAAQTEFPFAYKFNANADLLVYVDSVLKTITTDYTVAGAGLDAGGTVTFTTGRTAGEEITIFRSPAITQSVDYVENDPFPAETHEGALDKLTMICQALNDGLDRAVKLGVGSSLSDITLPEPEATKVLVWNAGETALENGPTTSEISNAQTYATSAAASAATATTQAGLATTARIAAQLAETNAETAEANAEAARDTILGYASGATAWTSANIDGGTIDDTTIGGTTPAAGSFTLLQATSGAFLSGISLGGGADVLGNYEKGEWTPVLRSLSGTYAHTYSVQAGRYLRIGDKVSVWGMVILTAKDAGMPDAAGVYLYGLPFTTADITGISAQAVVDMRYVGLTSGYTMFGGVVAKNDNKLAFSTFGSGVNVQSVRGQDIANNSVIAINTTLYLGD